MKTTLTFAALAATTLAQVQPFSAMALRSASPIHFAPFNAAEGKFWLAGEATSSYCPLATKSDCPAGNITIFTSDYKSDTLSLDVEVPGGQQVYVAPDGTLSFTQAHSANIPTGSITTGWSRSEGPSYGYLNYEGGLVACPVEGKGYQIYGLLPDVHYSDECLGFDAITGNQTEVGAWQYQ